MVQPLWKTVWKFPKELKVELPKDPAIPLLGTETKDVTTGPQRDAALPGSLQCYSQETRYGNNLGPLLDGWIKRTLNLHN